MQQHPPASVAQAADLITGRITVTTGSMVPLIRPGDDIDLRLGRPRPGDIILVGHAGTLLLHRVLRRDGAGLWLGGDATASWEGPFADQDWPTVTAIARAGRPQPHPRGPAAHALAVLLPACAGWPWLRRLAARLCREAGGRF